MELERGKQEAWGLGDVPFVLLDSGNLIPASLQKLRCLSQPQVMRIVKDMAFGKKRSFGTDSANQ